MAAQMSDKQREELIQEAIKRIGEYLKATKPYIFVIEKHIQERMKHGVISMQIRVHNGEVTDVFLEDTRRFIFTKKKTP